VVPAKQGFGAYDRTITRSHLGLKVQEELLIRDVSLDPSTFQETIMGQLLRAGAVTIAVFGSVGIAAAQRSPGTTQADLTPAQERMVSQGLASSPSQQAPSGAQPQVGNTLPEGLLFVKLPDRIVLIDPDTKLVTEIVMDATTTGSNPSSSSTPFR
jgi:hypothetical protein